MCKCQKRPIILVKEPYILGYRSLLLISDASFDTYAYLKCANMDRSLLTHESISFDTYAYRSARNASGRPTRGRPSLAAVTGTAAVTESGAGRDRTGLHPRRARVLCLLGWVLRTAAM